MKYLEKEFKALMEEIDFKENLCDQYGVNNHTSVDRLMELIKSELGVVK